MADGSIYIIDACFLFKVILVTLGHRVIGHIFISKKMIYLKGIYSYSPIIAFSRPFIHSCTKPYHQGLSLFNKHCMPHPVYQTDRQTKIFKNFRKWRAFTFFFLSQTFICSFYSLEITALPFVVYNHYLHDIT